MYDENFYADLEREERGQDLEREERGQDPEREERGQEIAELKAEEQRERDEAEYYPAEGVY